MKPGDVYQPLAEKMGLTTRQQLVKRRTTEESLWHNRVQTAREHLAKLGYMERRQHGLWSLTSEGRAHAEMLAGPVPDPDM
jgi:restriction endonuclease Mrr